MNLFKQALVIARKDIYTEWKTRQVVSMMLIFSGLVIVIFSFAFDPTNQSVKAVIPGILWVMIIFSGILGLNRSFLTEHTHHTLEGMIAAPVDPSAIYLGKILANLCMILLVELISLPLVFLLFDFQFAGSLVFFTLVVLLGTFGFISTGTLMAALSANSQSSEMLLPVLLLPVTTPLLIGVVQSTKIILTAPAMMPSAVSWMHLITAYDVVFFVLGFLLFEYVLEV